MVLAPPPGSPALGDFPRPARCVPPGERGAGGRPGSFLAGASPGRPPSAGMLSAMSDRTKHQHESAERIDALNTARRLYLSAARTSGQTQAFHVMEAAQQLLSASGAELPEHLADVVEESFWEAFDFVRVNHLKG